MVISSDSLRNLQFKTRKFESAYQLSVTTQYCKCLLKQIIAYGWYSESFYFRWLSLFWKGIVWY